MPRASHHRSAVLARMKMQLRMISVLLVLFFSGCVGIPKNVTPVDNFALDRYLGKWYEIARLDHSFERGLTNVTAEYSLRSDGGVRVLNRGYSGKDAKWKEVEGKAYFVQQPDKGYLKVSFFGPFYGAYVIFELDHEGYQYSLVCGPDKSYLWILARGTEISDEVKKVLIGKAAALGFDTDKLIFVKHQ
jgi:apolipoprotein D and lipocalin family protein